jgi:histidinol-phosphate aminotransferase
MWLPWLTQQLAGLGLKVLPSVGNFVLVEFPASGAKTATAANVHLNKHGIIPRAVANYGLPNHIRITIGTEAEMRAVVDALREFMK